MTSRSIVLGGAASQLRIAASALELAKTYMSPEQTQGFDKIIADDLELAAKIKQLVKEMETDSQSLKSEA
jgi:hypothetical protein